ncbi:MAG: RDD family protein [Halobacteriota archaeon]
MDEDKCALCGTPASPGAEYCVACGEAFTRKKSPTGQQPQGTPTYTPSPGVDAPTAFATAPPYQGVAIRFVAQLVDVIILGVVFWILGFTGAGTITVDAATSQVSISPFLGLLILIDVIIAFLYLTILEGRNGQTVGKMLVKIKVVKQADNSPISYGEAAVRTILRIIDLIPFFAPYLLAAVLIWSSENKQRLGDRVAHTVVVQS